MDRRRLKVSPNQPAQEAFLRDLAPGESLYQGGWGSGKTWAGSRKLALFHLANACPSFIVSPTMDDLWRFAYPEFINCLDEWDIKHVTRYTRPARIIVNRQPIFLLSGDKPERITGFEAGAGWVDEAARIRENEEDPTRDAPLQIRSRLRHKDAKVLHLILTGTAEGVDTWQQRDFFPEDGVLPPDRRAYVGRMTGNPALPEEYIDRQLRNIPAQLIDQYVNGLAVQFCLNRAHPGFNASHVREVEIDPGSTTIHVGQDFNVSPMCWVAMTITGPPGAEHVHVFDEMVLEDHAQVDAGMIQADDQGWGRFRKVMIHPDRSSKSRNTIGDSEVNEVRSYARSLGWTFQICDDGANPPVNNRINTLDRLIDPARGKPRFSVDPRCKRLRNELEQTGRMKNGHYDPGRSGKRGHILDGLGYAVHDELVPRAAVGGH